MKLQVFAKNEHDLNKIYSKNFFDQTYPCVSLEYERSTNLATVINEALPALKIQREEGEEINLVFGDGKRKDGYPDVHFGGLNVVDDKGAIRWYVPEKNWNTITLHNLLESKEAGLIGGNPLHIYVLLIYSYGNGYLVDWQYFLDQLKVVFNWAVKVGLEATVKYGLEVIKKRYKSWRKRGALPEYIFHYITKRKSWDARDLAKRLPTTEDEAKIVLKLVGYKYDKSSRLYIRSSDKNNRLIYNRVKDIFEVE